MYNKIAFIDEFGNDGLDFSKEHVSAHFIVTSIIIEESQLTNIEESIEYIRKKYFQTGEIKSSNVGKNDRRRLNILKDLKDLDFYIFSVVIDKRELKGEGFKYKDSFYKFLHSLVDRELFKIFPNLLVVSDDIGDKKFKIGFIKYIKNNHIPDLFNQSDFKLSNSKSNLLVQVADFITGTIARCYEPDKLSEKRSDFLNILKQKILELRFWPPDFQPYAYDPHVDFDNFDPLISELAINLAEQFLKKKSKSSVPADVDQCNCLKYLLFHFRNVNPESFLSTYELINHLDVNRSRRMSIHYFRSKVIAKLRDNDVIISSSNKGYKLPSSSMDLYTFVNHSNSYIEPMLARLIRCRNKIKMASMNKIDILDHKEFKYLKKVTDLK